MRARTGLASLLALGASVDARAAATIDPHRLQDTLSSGIWVVGFAVPRSLDSHQFDPSWRALVDSVTGHGIHTAQVDCARHAAQCRELGVFIYPQLSIYRDGIPLETYRGPREIHWQFFLGRVTTLAGMPTLGEERRAQMIFSKE